MLLEPFLCYLVLFRYAGGFVIFPSSAHFLSDPTGSQSMKRTMLHVKLSQLTFASLPQPVKQQVVSGNFLVLP